MQIVNPAPSNACSLNQYHTYSMYPSNCNSLYPTHGLPRWHQGKELTCQCRRHKRCRYDPWVRKIPWRREWLPISVFLPRESHGQRSLPGYSPQVHKESDTTEAIQYAHMLPHTMKQRFLSQVYRNSIKIFIYFAGSFVSSQRHQ